MHVLIFLLNLGNIWLNNASYTKYANSSKNIWNVRPSQWPPASKALRRPLACTKDKSQPIIASRKSKQLTQIWIYYRLTLTLEIMITVHFKAHYQNDQNRKYTCDNYDIETGNGISLRVIKSFTLGTYIQRWYKRNRNKIKETKTTWSILQNQEALPSQFSYGWLGEIELSVLAWTNNFWKTECNQAVESEVIWVTW